MTNTTQLAARRPNAKGSLFRDSGVTANGLITALTNIPDPDSVLDKAGLTRPDLRRLETDEEIYAALETRFAAVVSTPWRLDPHKDTQKRGLKFTEQAITPHLESLMRGVWKAVPYGYSVVELVYKRMGQGRIGLASAQEKPMEWFRPLPDGTLTSALAGTDERLDQDFKFMLTRRLPTWQNPYGEALLSRLYWPWYFRYNAWRFWMQFLERFGDPLLLGKAINPQDLSDALVSIGSDAHVVVGIEEEVNAVTQGNAGEFRQVEEALVKRVQKLILGQTLTSDVGKSGSYAAAKVHNEVRQDRRDADIRLVSDTVQRVVNALWALNRFSGRPPQFVMADGCGVQKDRAERDATLVNANVLRLSEEYLLRTYDYAPGDIEIPPERPPMSQQQLQHAHGHAQFAATQPLTANQRQVESLTDAALKQAPADPLDRRKIETAIKLASSPEDLAERLAILLADADKATFEATLEKALFAADVLGYVQEAKP